MKGGLASSKNTGLGLFTKVKPTDIIHTGPTRRILPVNVHIFRYLCHPDELSPPESKHII